MNSKPDANQSPTFWRSPSGIALCLVGLVLGFYLLTEHTAHLFGALPYLLVLACPLMHLFLHHGKHGHGHGHSQDKAGRPHDEHG